MYKTIATEEEQLQGNQDARLWRRIFGYCHGYVPALLGAALLALVVTVASLSLPWLMQMGIDQYITVEHLARAERLAGLQRLGWWYGALVLVAFVATFLQVMVLEWVGQSIMDRLRRHLFSHLLGMDLGFFHKHPVGRLVTRLTNDIQNLHEMFTSVMVNLFNDSLKLLGIFVFLALMNIRLALVMALFLPLSLLITAFFSRIVREKFRAIRSQLSRLNSFWAESLNSMAVIQSFGGQGRSVKAHSTLTQEYLQRNFGQIRAFGAFVPLIDFMASAAIALIIWYGGGEVIRRSLTLGELAAFISYMRFFFQPLRELAQKYTIVQSAMASVERIFQTIDTSSAMAEDARPAPYQGRSGAAAISFAHVNFAYTPGQPILEDINLQIAPGETVALVGATGAGKSTLVSLLARFYDPGEGAVCIDGQDVRALPLAGLRQRIGLIMQDIFILPDTVQANIILDRELDEQRLADIFLQTGLQDFIDRLPSGLQTRIGEGALHLSQGEKQLLSFIRALYRDPDILVLDEATASIDAETENMLERAIAVGFSDRTSLVIAHRLSTIRRADRIVVMDQGHIVEQGRHEQLMAKDSFYRRLVELDQHSGQ